MSRAPSIVRKVRQSNCDDGARAPFAGAALTAAGSDGGTTATPLAAGAGARAAAAVSGAMSKPGMGMPLPRADSVRLPRIIRVSEVTELIPPESVHFWRG